MKEKSRFFCFSAACLIIFITSARAQNGAAVCTTSADHSVTNCTIHQPVVDSRAEHGYRYPNVVFQAGDRVQIRAGGCVQTGGIGKTWKRYVNPSGKDSDHLYFGTITVPGATAPGFPVRISGVATYNIPASVKAPNNVLILGYKDDDYGGNGYARHDDGNNDQCAQGQGKDGGPAWVTIRIEHNKGEPVALSTVPFDVIADAVDANGLELNPQWQYEKDHPLNHPDAGTLCNGFPYSGGDRNVGFGSPACVPQGVTINQPAELSLNNALCNHAAASGKLHGHVNWWPATVTGQVIWAGHDSTIAASLAFGDDDYNFELYPSNNSLITEHHDEHDYYLETEFDSDETVDHFGSKWWNNFHDAVDKGGSASEDNGSAIAPASQMINNKQVIVTGLIGLDSEHGAYTELHPVYTMAIHLSADAHSDQWAFFARNWGDEGYCSDGSMIENWYSSTVSIFIPEPSPSNDYSFVAEDIHANKSLAVRSGKVPGGLVLSFDLGAPESQALVDGSVTINWLPSQPASATARSLPTVNLFPALPAATMNAIATRMKSAATETKESDAHKLPAGLSADKASALKQQLQKPTATKNTITVQSTQVAMTQHPQRAVKFVRPTVRAVANPARAAKTQRESKAVCDAYNNNLPGIPDACKN
jgi:hypothetical protein